MQSLKSNRLQRSAYIPLWAVKGWGHTIPYVGIGIIYLFFFSGKRVQRSDFGRMGGEGRRANGSPRLTLIRPLDLSRDHRERKATPRLAQNVLKWALPEAHVVQQAAQGPNVRALVEDALARAVEELRGPIRARGVGLRLLLREE